MIKGVLSHICFNIHTHHMTHICHKVLGRCIYKPKHQIKKCQLSNKTYSQGCQICHGKIRNCSKNQWKYHITKTC